MIDNPQSRDRHPPRPSPEQLLQQHREELQQRFALPSARPPRRSRKALLGPLLLLLASALLLWLDPAYHHESHVSGEQRQTVTLADGSQALLDSRTRLQAAWHLRSRRLTLEYGQVNLAVQRQPSRPLRVDAGALRIAVLGTTFSVLREHERAEVTVIEGRVAVTNARGTEHYELRAGDRILAGAGGLKQPQQVDLETAIAWTSGRLIFRRTPLEEAVRQMQRYHPAPIRLNEPALGGLPVSGALSTTRVAAFITALPALLPVAVTEAEDGGLRIDQRYLFSSPGRVRSAAQR